MQKALDSKESELIAVIGRRRVGKTYLVNEFFKGRIAFAMTGLPNGSKEEQLRNFTYSLKDAVDGNALPPVPKDWLEAFHMLKEHLEAIGSKEKRVVFIDELPWVATSRSGFLTGFSYFWNSYAARENIVVVVCGSATAWMIKKIIRNKKGLHNRVTRQITLAPFSLTETEAFLKSTGNHLDRYQILQLYMAMGGIPYYLKQVEKGKSAVQNIDTICFHPQGPLRKEFGDLYRSLFTHPEGYEAIIRALATKWKGLNRQEIVEATRLTDGGTFSKMLMELEQSGFITAYVPFQKKKKDTIYRLTDNYSLFYLKFIQVLPANASASWNTLSQTQTWKSWSGYAFENICLQHIGKIKEALGISGIHSQHYSYLAKGTNEQEGFQIDLLIDRADNSISICEVKFYGEEMILTKALLEKLRKQRSLFRHRTKTKKTLFSVLISTYGLASPEASVGQIDQVITMEDLF